jgi:hypothetical protein
VTHWESFLAPLAILILLALYRFVGCAQIAGLEDPDPTVEDPIPLPARLPPGLVGFWRLAEGPGTGNDDAAEDATGFHPGRYRTLSQTPQVSADSAPPPTTSLGTGESAAPDGGFKAGVEGIIRRGKATCVRFNGGFVRVFDPDPNVQGQLNPAGDFSLVAWAWPESPPPAGNKTYRSVITSRSDIGTSKQGYMLYAGPDDNTSATPVFAWQAWVGVGYSWRNVVGPPVRFDVPSALAVTYHHALARLRLYHVDLDPDAPIPDTLVPKEQPLAPGKYVAASAQRPLYIGAGRTDKNEPLEAPNYWFLGRIQEVRVYNRELPAEEIAGIFAAGAMSA